MNKFSPSLCAFAGLLAAAASTAALAVDPAVQPVTVRAIAYFDFDKASLGPQEQSVIMAEVSRMKGVTWQSVTAVGHTDSVGAPEYNAELSKRRAEAVKSYMVARGLNTDAISVNARASTAPAATNDTEAGRALNRRTEIEFRGVRTATP